MIDTPNRWFPTKYDHNRWVIWYPNFEPLPIMRPYFLGIFPYIGLTKALYMLGTSNQSVPEMAIDISLVGGLNPSEKYERQLG